MPFCPECGKPVAEKAKFCRNCGASQLEEAQPAPAVQPPAAPAPAPAPEPVPAQPAAPAPVESPAPAAPAPAGPAGLRCTSCNNPLATGEKFCGICGTKAGETPLSAAPAAAACPSCKTPYAPGTKFCGSCGASVGGAVPAVPAPAVGSARLCTACGNPIKPGDRYCSKCLVMVKDNSPVASVPAAAPAPVVTPAPVVSTAPAGSVRLCTVCGNPIKPGDKYCSKCLVMVKDNAPAVPVPSPEAGATAPVPAPAGGYACASCGSPLSGSEKFCGSCGSAAVAARTVAAAAEPPAAPTGKACGSCGAPVSEDTKFCGGCGAPVGASFPATITLSAESEPVLGVIPNARKMKMFGAAWDTFTIVITPRRMIFAQLTQEMLNTAIAEAQAKAKAEGKGFFGIVGDQLAASFGFGHRYETMAPDTALAETTGNTAIKNPDIRSISLTLLKTGNPGMDWHEFRMVVDTTQGKTEYIIAEDDRFTSLLQKVYGDRVKMPFGLFTAGPVRVKFF